MGDDGTEVELDELASLNATFRGLSDSIRETAATATNTHYDNNMFGALAWLFAGAATEAAGRTGRGLYALAANVMADATNVADSATEFEHNEQTQAARFRREHDG